MLGERKAMLFEFFRRIDGAKDFMKQLVRGLDLPPDFIKPFMRNVTIGASGPDT